MSLRSSLKGAKVVMNDSKRGFTLAWFGGHGVHVYDSKGVEFAFWNTGDFSSEDASEKDIRDSMLDVMKKGNYEDYT